MAENVEIKARLADPGRVYEQLIAASAEPPEIVDQEDTFFDVPKGNLKMRCDPAGRCELIYYQRPVVGKVMVSHYFCKAMPDPRGREIQLEKLFGLKGVVRKHRRVFHIGDARVHFDRVAQLGDVLEIEVGTSRKLEAGAAA